MGRARRKENGGKFCTKVERGERRGWEREIRKKAGYRRPREVMSAVKRIPAAAATPPAIAIPT